MRYRAILSLPVSYLTPTPHHTETCGLVLRRVGDLVGKMSADPTPLGPPKPLSPVPLLHSHPFGGFGLSPNPPKEGVGLAS